MSPNTLRPAADDFVAGRTALVTGAGNGLGRAIATALAQRGARLILTGPIQDKLEAVGTEIGAEMSGGTRRHVVAHLGKRIGRVIEARRSLHPRQQRRGGRAQLLP